MTWRHLPMSPRLLVHPQSGRAGRSIRALAGSSDWRRVLADWFGEAALVVAGAAQMPTAGELAWPSAGLDRIEQELRSELPGLELLGAVAPRQPGRQRMSLLAQMTGTTVIVKIGGPAGVIEREGDVLELLARDPLPGIETPEPVGRGTLDLGSGTIAYLATTALTLRRQRAAIDEPLRTFETDLALRLSSLAKNTSVGGPTAAERDPDADADPDFHPDPVADVLDDRSVPVHGDLTPWNLRRTPRGLALFDWESAGWGEPGSDIAFYRDACDLVRRPWQPRPTRRRSDAVRRRRDPLGAYR